MYMHQLIHGIGYFLLSVTLAQQSCWWPDGSAATYNGEDYINCHPNHDSHCCLKGEVCLSNGLCYGSFIGWTYRGGCTVQDWSNTTACPQYCNNMYPGMWANLWMCPHMSPPAVSWWCGNDEEIMPCQTANQAWGSFLKYTGGSILGLPPVGLASSTQAIVTVSVSDSAFIPTSAAASARPASVPSSRQAIEISTSPSTTVETSSFIITSAAATRTPPAPSPTATASTAIIGLPGKPRQAADRETAIGAGIGVPLGFLAMGLLGFLFWRERRRNKGSNSQKVGSRIIFPSHREGAELDDGVEKMEMPDAQVPWELDHRAVRVELEGNQQRPRIYRQLYRLSTAKQTQLARSVQTM